MKEEVSLVPIIDIPNLVSTAADLNASISRPDNEDLSADFPKTLQTYSMGIESALNALEAESSQFEHGKKEVYVVKMGSIAVGLGVIVLLEKTPSQINPATPNLSGFICHPYRAIGLGRYSLKKRLEIVDDRFGGRAWTEVRSDNKVSNHIVSSAGFKPLYSNLAEKPSSIVYTYQKDG